MPRTPWFALAAIVPAPAGFSIVFPVPPEEKQINSADAGGR